MIHRLKRLEGKNIVITGGSLGIGYEVALKCAENGARIAIVSRTEKDLRAAWEKLRSMSRQEHLCRTLNVGEKDHVRAFAGEIRTAWGSVDGLVNCAGVLGPIGRIDDIDMEMFVEAIRINLLGTAFMCHYFVPLMRNRDARIVNYSGGGATESLPNYSAYAASKAAVVRLTENLSKELSIWNIAVNAIAPGFVVTRLHQETLKAGEKAGPLYLKSTKDQIGKGGVPPEKAAELTVFLLSEESRGITGKLISAPWDPWQESSFQERLRKEEHLATLRRIDDKIFFEKR